MGIKKIKVTNFKSFDNLEVALNDFNVLIGANASGKSNFVQIFQFMRDIAHFGLENAVSMQGGVEYLRNINLGAGTDLVFEVVSDQVENIGIIPKKDILIGIITNEVTYEFILKFDTNGTSFKIAKDILTQKCKFVRLEIKENEIIEKEKIGDGEIIRSVIDEEPTITLYNLEKIDIQERDIMPFSRFDKFPPNTLLAQTASFFMAYHKNFFYEISIYDLNPKLSKQAVSITGKVELEEDGSNLSIILKNILADKEKKRTLFNLVNDLLPFINNLEVEKFADKSLYLKLREIYHENQYLPASFISDGTINITALIIALYFGKKGLTIVEEPERNIHPSLIAKIIDMMKDASQKKQIIITTHNPEIVKHAGLENILLISRNKNGFSTISPPGDKKEVKTFLKNEIGIEELFLQNLLGV